MQTLFKGYHPEEQVPASDLFSSIGLPSGGILLHEAIRQGLPFSVFDKISNVLGLDKKDILTYAMIAPATLARRAKAGNFNPDESDRLVTMVTVFRAAVGLFEGDIDAAKHWMTQPVLGLGRHKPIEMLATNVGASSVMDLIGRLEYGVYS